MEMTSVIEIGNKGVGDGRESNNKKLSERF